ncbi:MAG: DEAD/DEAH box helicase family protein [Clostridia bacterium]
MNIYDGVLEFKGKWRSYQERVLHHAEEYLSDNKVHIVAAPGSGKTTLGIELIRRLGNPCLILAPSITIRQQWLSRMEEGFLAEGEDAKEWFSNDIRNAKPITAITYQALYSCMKQYVGRLEYAEDEGEEDTVEMVDYSDLDIYQIIRKAQIRTLCLDEAHHLRSEWWKSLEAFLNHLPDVKLVSLTATPPYDSTPAQWKRYIDLCGPIDEEIFTPELVKEGSLCPHQDYVYFSWPTKDELDAVREYTLRAGAFVRELRQDDEFKKMVSSHEGLLAPEEYGEKFLDNPKYFSSILIYLQEMGIPFSPYLKKLIGTKGHLPMLDSAWLEVLLQGFLYDDTEAYPSDTAYREGLIARLKAAGCIYRNKVRLVRNDEIDKILIRSRGKLNSILEIVKAEYASLGNGLRLLVLCDYIKREYMSRIGGAEAFTGEIGAVPIFEYLRRASLEGMRLGVLSGSVIIVPMDVEAELAQLLQACACGWALEELEGTGYGRLMVKGKSHDIVAVITELFSRGRIHALVGTKSLLGEGWDSPCINSLVLATYVGSFMLSNQMRGRAIRTFPDQPDKTSNIWHLACILTGREGEREEGGTAGDYETLVRRFDAFLGISYKEDVIESGIERLELDTRLDCKSGIRRINSKMLEKSGKRDALRRSWDKSLKVIHDDICVEEVQEVDKRILEPGYLFLNAVTVEVVSWICMILIVLFRMFLQAGLEAASFWPAATGVFFLAAAACAGRYGVRIFKLCTPQKRMNQAAEGILDALIRTAKLEEPQHCKAEVKEEEFLVLSYLKGGTTRDKTLFAECLAQFFGIIDNPRYLLIHRKGSVRTGDCYAVPDTFGRKKEDAAVFRQCMKRVMGNYDLIYTRTPEGRRMLLKARIRSFAAKNERILTGRKQVKGKYE